MLLPCHIGTNEQRRQAYLWCGRASLWVPSLRPFLGGLPRCLSWPTYCLIKPKVVFVILQSNSPIFSLQFAGYSRELTGGPLTENCQDTLLEKCIISPTFIGLLAMMVCVFLSPWRAGLGGLLGPAGSRCSSHWVPHAYSYSIFATNRRTVRCR